MSTRWKLHWAPTSPYVRKVMIVAHELGLADRFELVATRPETVVADVAADNPLGRIPALVLADGTTLFDSLVIAEFLDETAGGSLFPRAGPRRWRTLTRHALAQGAIDAAIAIVAERRRPALERSPGFLVSSILLQYPTGAITDRDQVIGCVVISVISKHSICAYHFHH